MAKFLLISFFPAVFLMTCRYSNFYPDADDQGLSRFTSHGYNIVSAYVNGEPYTNEGVSNPVITKDSGLNNTLDTLVISWSMRPTLAGLKPIYGITFSIPVLKSFSQKDFLTMSDERLANVLLTVTDSSMNKHTGMGNLFFVKLQEIPMTMGSTYLQLSGLFDGITADSIILTKGRLDFSVDTGTLNF